MKRESFFLILILTIAVSCNNGKVNAVATSCHEVMSDLQETKIPDYFIGEWEEHININWKIDKKWNITVRQWHENDTWTSEPGGRITFKKGELVFHDVIYYEYPKSIETAFVERITCQILYPYQSDRSRKQIYISAYGIEKLPFFVLMGESESEYVKVSTQRKIKGDAICLEYDVKRNQINRCAKNRRIEP